jgi:hypothetical protein
LAADDEEIHEEADLLGSPDATAYRAIAARCNYLQPDSRISSSPSRSVAE